MTRRGCGGIGFRHSSPPPRANQDPQFRFQRAVALVHGRDRDATIKPLRKIRRGGVMRWRRVSRGVSKRKSVRFGGEGDSTNYQRWDWPAGVVYDHYFRPTSLRTDVYGLPINL
jgi:hypothetical protein